MTDYRAEAVKAANRYGIPVQPFLAQLQQESGFRPGVTSSAGARWIGQFIPSTARAYGVHDDLSSIYGAAHYMADNLKRYGSLPRALSAYNSGRPDAYLDPHFAGGQTYNYVRNIVGAHAPVASAPAAAPTTVTAPGAPAAPALFGGHAALFNAGNRMFGLPAFKSAPQAPVAVAPAAAGAASKNPHVPATVALIKTFVGTPYKWGGADPKTGFDCSGLVQYVHAQNGVQIPRTTYEQFKAGRPVAKGALRPGDAVFFEPTRAGPGHEGMYVGGGLFVEAPHTGAQVRFSKLAGRKDYVGARRF